MQIGESLQKILSRKETVIDQFYLIFLDRHPDVREHFVDVNIQHQATLLTMALIMLECHYSNSYPATEQYLRILGHRHHVRGIAPELYPKFRDCLIETLQQFHGHEWDEPLEIQWRNAIDRAVDKMLDGYRQPYVY